MYRQLTKDEVIAALKASKGMVTIAADKLGCTPQTVHNWIKRSPEVQAVVNAERDSVLDAAEIALMGAIGRKEGWAIAFALKTIGKNRGYVERTEQVRFTVDERLIQRVIDALEKQGLSASDVFENLVAAAAEGDRVEVSTDGDTTDEDAG